MGKVLVVGGTKGLGLQLAKKFSEKNFKVVVTGRSDQRPQNLPAEFGYHPLNLSDGAPYETQLNKLVTESHPFHTIIFAAGFLQFARIWQLSDREIKDMLCCTLAGPAMLMSRVLRLQSLNCFIAITSTSAEKPRVNEPLYSGAKRGLEQFARCIAEDSKKIHKTLVAAPAGMISDFWPDGNDVSEFMDTELVARKIMRHLLGGYVFKSIQILRENIGTKTAPKILARPRLREIIYEWPNEY